MYHYLMYSQASNKLSVRSRLRLLIHHFFAALVFLLSASASVSAIEHHNILSYHSNTPKIGWQFPHINLPTALILIDEHNDGAGIEKSGNYVRMYQNQGSARVRSFSSHEAMAKFILSFQMKNGTEKDGIVRRSTPIKHFKATTLSLILYGTVYFCLKRNKNSGVPLNQFYGQIGTVYFLYLLESFYCSTRRYLSNLKNAEEMDKFIKIWTNENPLIQWTLECFHYRYRRGTRNNGHKGTRDKVVTLRVHDCFRYNDIHHNDIDLDKSILERFAKSSTKKFYKIKFSKFIIVKDQALQDYWNQQGFFTSMNRHRDVYHELFTSVIFPHGFQSRVLLHADNANDIGIMSGGSKNFVSTKCFWMLTMMGLTVPYRRWFASKCENPSEGNTMHILIVKEISS